MNCIPSSNPSYPAPKQNKTKQNKHLVIPCLKNMSHFLRKVLVPHMLLMVILLNTNTVKAAIFDAPKEISVKIINDLESNENLTIHCKSGDNDLGVQVLKPNVIYEFNFKTNVWGSTLFFCGFSWLNEFHWFDIFKAKRDDCNECPWSIFQAGPCLYGPKGICYQWNRKWCGENC